MDHAGPSPGPCRHPGVPSGWLLDRLFEEAQGRGVVAPIHVDLPHELQVARAHLRGEMVATQLQIHPDATADPQSLRESSQFGIDQSCLKIEFRVAGESAEQLIRSE